MKELFPFLLQTLTHLNWVDYLIIAAVLLYALEGFFSGFIIALFDIINFFLSFAAGLLLYKPLGNGLAFIIHAPTSFTHITSFVLGAVTAEVLLRLLQNYFLAKLKKIPGLVAGGFWVINQFLGIIPGIVSGVILIIFFLTVFAALPVSGSIKQSIGDSKLGSLLIGEGQNFEKSLMQIVGGGKNDLLTFVTIEPQDNTTISLHITVKNGQIDSAAENQMLILVNRERTARKLSALIMDGRLQKLARGYANNMLSHGYFSHFSLDGKSPFDRMNDADISYFYAGENLAFSPNVNFAMQGLMASPGHKANILSPNFHKIGIGVIDGGIYGEMFVQEFTD